LFHAAKSSILAIIFNWSLKLEGDFFSLQWGHRLIDLLVKSLWLIILNSILLLLISILIVIEIHLRLIKVSS